MRFRKAEGGFTLVEILAAITLLALGLTTLLGMQRNYVDSYSRELNQAKAALYAQYLMTMYEAASPELSQPESSLENGLREFGYFDEPTFQEEAADLSDWTFELLISPVPVFEGLELLRRLDLTIRWSEQAGDRFQLVYFQRVQSQ